MGNSTSRFTKKHSIPIMHLFLNMNYTDSQLKFARFCDVFLPITYCSDPFDGLIGLGEQYAQLYMLNEGMKEHYVMFCDSENDLHIDVLKDIFPNIEYKTIKNGVFLFIKKETGNINV